jgi:histidine ammonia-lyase
LGHVIYEGKIMETKEAFKLANIEAIDHLKAKEGLSLINGTQGMCAIGGLVLYDAINLLALSNLSLSLTMEALEAIPLAFLPQVHEIRNQIGQMIVAEEVLENLEGSTYLLKGTCERVQDAYSIRCAPQVHGASLDAINHVHDIVLREMNAVTDNPLVFHEDDLIISAGNFHGQPLALAFDYLAIAISELANISERRIERMVNPNLSNGLPPFLVKKPGINSGFMIVQYTAASLVSENKVLSHPASVDSIPSSANQEDHVSMGSISARKAKSILENARKVIAMEIFTACQAIDLRDQKTLGKKTQQVYDKIRKEIPLITDDVIMYPYLHKIEKMITETRFLDDIF